MPTYTSFPKNEYDLVKSEIQVAIQRVLDSGMYVLGQEVTAFEQEFAKYIGRKYCVGVNNGTDALTLALRALHIGPGDEVITTPFTAAYTALSIIYVGAKPVFVDIDPATYNIDASKIAKAITKRTKAIIPVHLFGQPADMASIMLIARKHKLKVIEDACQAHGAQVGKRKVGTFGDIACFSFYPTKNLGGIGDGGAIVTNNTALAKKIDLLRNGHQTKKYYHTEVGYNTRLDEVQAAILRIKLKNLPTFIAQRQAVAKTYDTDIADAKVVKPTVLKGMKHVYHLYVIRHPKRDAVLRALAKYDIHVQVHYPWSLHKLPAFKSVVRKNLSLPISELASKQVMSLPIYPGLTAKQIQTVVKAVNSF